MMPDKKDETRITLDDLFVLKRAERPPQAFWEDFQRELHVRQRAAAIEPKRWWFVLPRVFVGLSRYQMPMGAAAVLAVTFLSFREYREPGLEIAYAPTPAAMAAGAVKSAALTPAPVVNRFDAAAATASGNDSAPANATEVATRAAPGPEVSADPLTISPLVVWAGVATETARPATEEVSPSARSIAANLATIKREQPGMVRLLGGPELQLTATAPGRDPLADVSLPGSAAREPLFAYKGAEAAFSDTGDEAELPQTHTLIARRLNDDLLYEQVSRLSAGGDRLTLKF